jgi:drug/metabolite transporter (DMT)-like permease
MTTRDQRIIGDGGPPAEEVRSPGPYPGTDDGRMAPATVGRFVLQAAIWGSSFTLIQVALRDMSASLLVLLRLALAAVVLGAIVRSRRLPLVAGSWTWVHVTVAAVLGSVAPYLLLSFGEGHTSASVAGVLVGATPMLTVLVAAAALPQERTGRRQVAGYLLGFAGVVLVLSPWGADLGSPWARLACFGAAASYAGGYVYVRRFLSDTGVGPLSLATSQLIAATAVQAVVTPLLPWQTPHLQWNGALSILVLGLLGTGYATILYFRLIADVGASTAAAVDYLVPVFAVLFGVTLLSEPVTWNLLVGGLTVLVGMAVVEGRLTSFLTRRGRPAAGPVAPGLPAPGLPSSGLPVSGLPAADLPVAALQDRS